MTPSAMSSQVADPPEQGSASRALCPGDRIAFLVSRYPAVTHTFIAEQIRSLREVGVDVETVSIRRPDSGDVVSGDHRRELESTRALLPARPVPLVGDHVVAFARAPLAYCATLVQALRMSSGGLRAGAWQLFYFVEAIMLWRHLGRRGVQHVHVEFPTGAADAAMLATGYANRSRRARGPRRTWSLALHGPTEFTDITAGHLAAKIEDADAVICVSYWVYSQVLAWTPPSRPERIHVALLGVDLDAFTPRRSHAPTSQVRVLNIGAMSPRKGQSVLVRALARLVERGRDVTLTLVGDGPERAALEDEVVRLGLSDRVSFLGSLGHDQVRDCFASADIFCMPSLAEGMPTVLLEAMASGVPVVATTIAGTAELVEHGVSGLLVTPTRDDELAEALDALATNTELRRSFAAAGRARVEAERDLRVQTAEVRRVIGLAMRP